MVTRPVLVVDGDARPVGWSDPARSGSVMALGATFDPETDSLRTALDAALTSPVGLAVAVTGESRRYAGVVDADMILHQVTQARAQIAESIAVRTHDEQPRADVDASAERSVGHAEGATVRRSGRDLGPRASPRSRASAPWEPSPLRAPPPAPGGGGRGSGRHPRRRPAARAGRGSGRRPRRRPAARAGPTPPVAGPMPERRGSAPSRAAERRSRAVGPEDQDGRARARSRALGRARTRGRAVEPGESEIPAEPSAEPIRPSRDPGRPGVRGCTWRRRAVRVRGAARQRRVVGHCLRRPARQGRGGRVSGDRHGRRAGIRRIVAVR